MTASTSTRTTRTDQDRAVVVGVDGSEGADLAVRWAAAEAARRQVPLRLVTAFPWATGEAGHRTHGEAYRSELLAERQLHLDRVAEQAGALAPDVDVRHHVTVGHPNAVLGAESRRAARRSSCSVTAGSAPSPGCSSARRRWPSPGGASCPVVVVRGDGLPAVDLPVVVGVDDTPACEDALALAFDAAAVRGVPLVAVHAWWTSSYLTPPDPVDVRADGDAQQQQLTDRLAGWTQQHPDVTVRQVLSRRPAAEALLAEAAGAQLVVVGSGGRGALAGLVLGSVSQALLQHAGCPVAVVRPQG